jgi:hypothetical protein
MIARQCIVYIEGKGAMSETDMCLSNSRNSWISESLKPSDFVFARSLPNHARHNPMPSYQNNTAQRLHASQSHLQRWLYFMTENVSKMKPKNSSLADVRLKPLCEASNPLSYIKIAFQGTPLPEYIQGARCPSNMGPFMNVLGEFHLRDADPKPGVLRSRYAGSTHSGLCRG